jgi:hypothetical protein
VLDGLKPNWLLADNPPQTGGLHEAFGDLTAIFMALSQLDQCEAIIAQTKAKLHDKTFLADIAEQFGLALGRSNGLRNADNDITLSEAGTQVHAISQVFTGAMYDILADVFAFERSPGLRDDAAVLHEVGDYLKGLLLRALIAAPDQGATFADVVNEMLRLLPGTASRPTTSASSPATSPCAKWSRRRRPPCSRARAWRRGCRMRRARCRTGAPAAAP